MQLEQLPLGRQVELVFRAMKDELCNLKSGTVFIQIRNNTVGKFGVRHHPIVMEGGQFSPQAPGLTETQFQSFRHMGVEALKYKHWTHGEILLDFTIRHNQLCASISFESNYNLASLSTRVGT